ncbi:MAG: hypothetical protein GY793_10875 [Proteobacteria bacterium]|nr:hypothetical protein [Pseudomonadota bacterium]
MKKTWLSELTLGQKILLVIFIGFILCKLDLNPPEEFHLKETRLDEEFLKKQQDARFKWVITSIEKDYTDETQQKYIKVVYCRPAIDPTTNEFCKTSEYDLEPVLYHPYSSQALTFFAENKVQRGDLVLVDIDFNILKIITNMPKLEPYIF